MALAGQSYKVAPPSFQLQIHPSCPVSAIATWARCFVIGWTFLDASLVDTLSIVALPWPAQLGPEILDWTFCPARRPGRQLLSIQASPFDRPRGNDGRVPHEYRPVKMGSVRDWETYRPST
jgi:hypothetical protein